MTLRHLAVCLALLTGPHVQAAPPETVSVEFRLFAWQTTTPALRYSRTGVVEPVEPSSRSAVHTYQGPPELSFTLAKARTVNGQPPAPVATVRLPEGVGKLTLLTVATGSGAYEMHVLPEDPAALPPKHARLHNFTNVTLRVNYNQDEQVDIASGKSALLAARGRGIVAIVSRLDGDRWRPLFSGVIMPRSDGGPNVLLAVGMENAAVNLFTVPVWPAEKS